MNYKRIYLVLLFWAFSWTLGLCQTKEEKAEKKANLVYCEIVSLFELTSSSGTW